MNDQTIEQEITSKNLTAPRVTPDDIEANITDEHYFTAGRAIERSGGVNLVSVPGEINQSLHLLTFCVIVVRNGFTFTGESACVSPENFDAELGRKIARQNAVQKMWTPMGYELKQRLTGGSNV